MKNELSDHYSKLPSQITDSLKLVPHELLELPFSEIEKKACADIDLRRLRISFWQEYDRSSRTGTGFNLANIYRGIMSMGAFRKNVLNNTYRTLYLTIPPPAYKVILEEMLHYGLMFEREILEMNHFNEKGVDMELLKLKHNIVKGVHDRVKGLPVAKTLMVSKEIKDSDGPQELSIKDVDAEIKKLKEELGESDG